MTTDIKELMQELKAELSAVDDTQWYLAKPSHIRALVEALEKAQRYIERLREWNAGLAQESCERQQRIDELESQRKLAFAASNRWADKFREAEQRIAELQESNAQVIHSRDHYKRVSEFLARRSAELKSRAEAAESRSVTVKLPKPHAHLIWIQAGHAPDDFWNDVAVSHSEKDRCCDGSDRYPVYARWEIEEALSAAGIQIQGCE